MPVDKTISRVVENPNEETLTLPAVPGRGTDASVAGDGVEPQQFLFRARDEDQPYRQFILNSARYRLHWSPVRYPCERISR